MAKAKLSVEQVIEFIMTSRGYVHKEKETKKGREMGSININVEKAWPKICMFASENDDQLLSVSIKDEW